MEVPRPGTESEACVTATATQDPSVSVTYTTAHPNAGSLTHWVGPGIEPTSLWILVGFVTHWATRRTPYPVCFKRSYFGIMCDCFVFFLYASSLWEYTCVPLLVRTNHFSPANFAGKKGTRQEAFPLEVHFLCKSISSGWKAEPSFLLCPTHQRKVCDEEVKSSAAAASEDAVDIFI